MSKNIRMVNKKNQITLTDEAMEAVGIEKEDFVKIEYDKARKRIILTAQEFKDKK